MDRGVDFGSDRPLAAEIMCRLAKCVKETRSVDGIDLEVTFLAFTKN